MSLLETNSISNKIKWYFAIKVGDGGIAIALLNFIHYLHLKCGGKLYPFVQSDVRMRVQANSCWQIIIYMLLLNIYIVLYLISEVKFNTFKQMQIVKC